MITTMYKITLEASHAGYIHLNGGPQFKGAGTVLGDIVHYIDPRA